MREIVAKDCSQKRHIEIVDVYNDSFRRTVIC